MLPGLKRDDDGGVTLAIQHADPGAGEQANWLPAPTGPFLVVMRLYWPKADALDGRWKAPPLVQVAEVQSAPSLAAAVPVTPENFARAESDRYFGNVVKDGGFGKFSSSTGRSFSVPDDIDNVKKIQAGYKVQPLSQFLGKPAPAAAPAVDFIKPLSPEAERTSLEFFSILNFVLRFCPPNPAETDILARFAKLGIGPHGTFDAKALSPEMLKAVQDGMADAWAEFKTYKETQLDTGKRTSADAFGTREFLNGDYSRPLLGRSARHLRQLEGRGDISGLFRRQRQEAAERGERL